MKSCNIIYLLFACIGVTYDISNKHRLGYTEVQLVQTMIDGVNKLYEEDLELQKKHEGEKTTPGGFPEIKSKHSLVAKHVTEDKWRKLSDHETKTCGFTLAQVKSFSTKIAKFQWFSGLGRERERERERE